MRGREQIDHRDMDGLVPPAGPLEPGRVVYLSEPARFDIDGNRNSFKVNPSIRKKRLKMALNAGRIIGLWYDPKQAKSV
jgi:hypothetical protein